MSRLLVVLVALLVGACNAPVQVWTTPGLAEQTAVAVESWNAALAEHCPSHPGLVLVEERSESDVQVAWGVHPSMPDKGGVEEGGHIVVSPRLKGSRSELLQHVVAHEIGHAIGARHDARSWLMRPTRPVGIDGVRISPDDVAQVCGTPRGTPSAVVVR